MPDENIPIIDTPEAKELINQTHGHQQNIKMALVEMIQQAKDPFDIIYSMAEYLEKESAERGYAQHVLENLRTVYGIALGNQKLLRDEISDTEARAERIRQTKQQDIYTDEQKARMEFAIKAHERMIEALKKQLAETEA